MLLLRNYTFNFDDDMRMFGKRYNLMINCGKRNDIFPLFMKNVVVITFVKNTMVQKMPSKMGLIKKIMTS